MKSGICVINRLRVGWLNDGRGAVRVEDAQGTLTQSHISPSTLVYKDWVEIVSMWDWGFGDRPLASSIAAPTPFYHGEWNLRD